MKQNSMKSTLLLLLAAGIWGVAFVAQSVGMDYVGPFTFGCARNLLGAAVLLPCIAFLDRWRKGTGEKTGYCWNALVVKGGVCCGIALFIASNLQQFGLLYTTVGKSGFITALYIVLVPVFGIVLKKAAGLQVWLSVVLAVAGLYLLCMTEAFTLQFGDFLTILCAAAFSVQILLVDYFSPGVDSVRLACLEFFVCGLLCGVGMLLTEQPSLLALLQGALPILYAGIFSSGVAYTLQIVGQKETEPALASLIMSLESVVSVLAGWLILGQHLSVRELLGCAVMFLAILLAQTPTERLSRKKAAD